MWGDETIKMNGDSSKSYSFLGKQISGKFTIGSGIVTVTCDTIKLLSEKIPELGVLTTKSIGPIERDGNREPVLAGLNNFKPLDSSSDMDDESIRAHKLSCVNAVGLANPGAKLFTDELKTLKLADDKFLLISIFGGNTDDFVEVAKQVAPYADGLELNFSCPHAEGHGQAICATPGLAADVVKAVEAAVADVPSVRRNKDSSFLPLVPKLSPNLGEEGLRNVVGELSKIKSVRGFTACNTFGPWENKHKDVGQHILSKGKGGGSGPAVKDEAVKVVQVLANECKEKGIEIIGMGGISTVEDCKEFLAAGANVLGVGTSLLGLDTAECAKYFAELEAGSSGSCCDATESCTKKKSPVVPMDLVEYTVKTKTMVNDKLALMEFDGPEYKCDAGQFLELWVPEMGEKPFAPSVTSPLTMAIGDVGILTNYLVSKSEIGSKIYVRGPYGKGFIRDKKKNETIKTHVLVGGGTGIAPLLLLAEQLCKSNGVAPENIWVYLGGRTAEHVYHIEDFKKYSSQVVVATNDGSAGFKGFVTQALEADLPNDANPAEFQFYNCGPEVMMNAAVKLIEKFGSENIECSIERYMKCGVGICGVCSCDGYRTCVDGPVFNYDFVKNSEMFGKVHRAKNTKLLDW